jgi:hypothetical protein
MDDLKVDSGEISFALEDTDNAILSNPAPTMPVPALPPSTPAPSMPAGDGVWTESMMRELLAEVPQGTLAELLLEAKTKDAYCRNKIRNSTERLYSAVSTGSTADIIDLMCDLSAQDLRVVVSSTEHELRLHGLSSVDVRVDDFDRIVLFDEQNNRGFAMAPSGSYQRVSRFYDGSYRYGIELLLDDSMFESVDAVFQTIKGQLVGH